MALVTIPRKGADLETVRKALVQLSDQIGYLLSCQEDATLGLTNVTETLKQAQVGQQDAIDKQKQQQKTLRQQIIDTAYEITLKYQAAMNVLESSIEASVKENYAAKSDLGTLEAQMESKVTQNSTSITNLFTSVEKVSSDFGDYQATVAGWQRFTSDGIELGKEGSPFTALLGSERLSFKQSGVEIAYISNNKLFITTAQVADSLQLGNTARGVYSFEAIDNALVLRKGV